MKKANLFIAFLLTLAFSCNEDVNPNKIHPELQVYVDRFVAEAKLRGREILTGKLTVEYATLSGSCGTGLSDPQIVKIDSSCWRNYPEIAREILMFHELGHAILGRGHDSNTLPNGDYRSVMYKYPEVLYNAYVPSKRTYYLDELFDDRTPIPNWSLPKANEKIILTDKISDSGAWRFVVSGIADHNGAVDNSVYLSPPGSLMIKSNSSSTGFSYWAYSWKPTDIEEGNDLLLKVKIKAKGLTAPGAYLAFRADIDNEVVFFSTTQGKTSILGEGDFGEYSINLNYFPNSLPTLTIFLILDGTSVGTVYFDDIELTKYY